jgi:hypothetical protein
VPSLRRQRVELGQPQYRVRPVQAWAAACEVDRPPFGGPAHCKAEETVMGKVKKVVAKKKADARFATEKPSSPDFGKSRKDWNAAKKKGK